MKIIYSPTYTTVPLVDGAPLPDKVVVEIFDTANNLVQSSDTAPYEFTGVADGTYTLRASRLDVSGAVMGTAYTEDFTVTTAPVGTVDLPTGGTITQVAE